MATPAALLSERERFGRPILFRPAKFPRRRYIQVRVRENITSTMASAAQHTPMFLEEAARRSSEAVARNIKGAYASGRASAWLPLTEFTIRLKGATRDRIWILRESGKLDRAVMALRPSGYVVGRTFVVDMSDTEWPKGEGGFPYVFAHEFGIPRSRFRLFGRPLGSRLYETFIRPSGRDAPMRAEFRVSGLPRRGFLREGLVMSGDEIAVNFAGAIGGIRMIFQKPEQMGARVQEYESREDFGFGAFRMNLQFFLFAFIPPTRLLSFVGAASDIASLIKLNFTSRTAALYIRSYALGQFGLTPKTRRRRFRRSIYAGWYS